MRDHEQAPLPVIQVDIGSHELDTALTFEIRSTSAQPIDWLDLELDNPSGDGPEITRGDSVELSIGYSTDRVLPVVFTGTVRSVQKGRTTMVQCADKAVELADLVVVRSWANVRPGEIAHALFTDINVTDFEVFDGVELPRRPHFIAPKLTGLQVFDQVAQIWGLDWQLYANPDGSFWWGPWQESPRQRADRSIQLREGVDTFLVERGDAHTAGRLVLECEPTMRHTDVIGLFDVESGNAPTLLRAVSVTHASKPHDALPNFRTEVEWQSLA
jgi:hypothetical protein